MPGKKVLGIYGSPRKGGNSDLLLDAALEGARCTGAEVSSIYVRDLKIPGCRECGGCDQTGECGVEDDMQKVYPLLKRAEVVFLASPVFFYGFPAQLKALIDRAQALWAENMREKGSRPGKASYRGAGYLLAVGATKGENLFLGLELTARCFFDAFNLSYAGGILLRGMEGKAAIRNHPEFLQQALALGKQVSIL